MTEQRVDFDPFRAGVIERVAPSTEPQREIITSALMGDEANVAFNEAVSLRVVGDLSPSRLELGLQHVVDRYDALRMTFTRSGSELCVSDGQAFQLERRDFKDRSPEQQEQGIRQVWHELVSTPMNLFDGPLFRAVLIELGDSEFEFVLGAHHVVCDGWSFYVILNELSQWMSDKPSTSKAPSFADFAERQAAEIASNADIDYWLDQFRITPPTLDLPTDRPRPANRTFAARRYDYVIGSDLTKQIAATAGKLRASVVNVTLAAVTVLLNKLCHVDDIVVGLPVARQSTDNLPELVGHGVQLLPIRLALEDETGFNELVRRAKTAILDARDHPNFTFGSLIRELHMSGDASRVPLVPVIFNIDQPFDKLQLGSAEASVSTVPRIAENFEIFLNILPSDDTLVIEATYNTDLFSEETMVHWLNGLEAILGNVVSDPECKVAAIGVGTKRDSTLEKLNDTKQEVSANTWVELFAEQVRRTPEKVAVKDRQGVLTYEELDRRGRSIAEALKEKGVGEGGVVGIYMDRTRALPATILGVHLTGAAYLPLDPSFPESRLQYMLTDAGADIIVTDIELPRSLGKMGVAALEFAAIPEATGNIGERTVDGQALAYLIYTSGSTGDPKGVEIPHLAVTNFLSSMARQPGMDVGDKLIAVTTLSFDISVLELLLGLTVGAEIYVATREQAGDVRQLAQLVEAEQATIMQATPATWRLLVTDGWKGDRGLKALCGGEPLPADLARALVNKVESLWNMYGPTETTIWSTCEEVAPDFDSISIGKPIGNTSIHILDESGIPLPPTFPAELCIGGLGLARGYHNKPELTAAKFIEHPELGRIYRTGDLARIRADGSIEHLGRMDDQVKVRGFRIELGEIETALREFDGVDQAAVHVWEPRSNDTRIVACCVPEAGKNIAPIALRKHLRGRLPEYMVPQHFLTVDSIPLTPNGKVNRRALPNPVVTESTIGQHETPQGAVEMAIAAVWTSLVNPDRPIGRKDRFFEIGGHSLLGLEALRQIEERLKVRLHPRALFQENLSGIARMCAEGGAEKSAGDELARPVHLEPTQARLPTAMQEQIARNCAANPDTLRYHIPFCFRIEGSLDYDAFKAALRALFERHAILRTVFNVNGSEVKMRETDVVDSLLVDLATIDNAESPEKAAMDLMIRETQRPYDIDAGPLVRMLLIKLDDRSSIFLFMPHQLVFDGWSFDIFLRELNIAYSAISSGKKPAFDDLQISFSDFSTWRRNSKFQEQNDQLLAFWRAAFANPPGPINWPQNADNPGGKVERVRFNVDRDAIKNLESSCAAAGLKLANVILAAFVRALASQTNCSDLFIDLATSGRFLPETAPVVGPFYYDLPLRLNGIGQVPIGMLCADVQNRVDACTAHQDVPADLLSRLATDSDLRLADVQQVAYSFQEARSRSMNLGSLSIDQISVSRPDIIHDVDFWVRNTAQGLIASIDYRASIAERDFFERIRDEFLSNLHEAMTSGLGIADSASMDHGVVAGEARDDSPTKRGLLDRMRRGRKG